MGGILAMGGNRISGVADPTGTQDVATKNCVNLLGSPRYVITSGTVPATTNSDTTIYTLPTVIHCLPLYTAYRYTLPTVI